MREREGMAVAVPQAREEMALREIAEEIAARSQRIESKVAEIEEALLGSETSQSALSKSVQGESIPCVRGSLGQIRAHLSLAEDMLDNLGNRI